MPKKFFPQTISTLTTKQNSILTSVKEFGVVLSEIQADDTIIFKEVYMRGMEAEKVVKFDHYDPKTFYAITNNSELFAGDFDHPNKIPDKIKLNAARPLELSLNHLIPSIGAVIDSQGVIEM